MHKKLFIRSNSSEIKKFLDNLKNKGVNVEEELSFGLDTEILKYVVTFTSQTAVIVSCIISYKNYMKLKAIDKDSNNYIKAETKNGEEIDITNFNEEEIKKKIEDFEKLNFTKDNN